jgi:tetratricopeptide (TPR) repeat protein
MGKRGLTVRERIIAHLYPYQRHAEDFECPAAMCQAGISAAVGKSRAHTTLELGRMLAAGLLHERIAHVAGARSKRKTYSLSAEGMDIGQRISEHLAGIEVELRGSSQARILNGAGAAKALADELAVPWAMAVHMVLSSGGTLDLDRCLQGLSDAAAGNATFQDQVPDDQPVSAEPTTDSGNVLEAHVIRANMLSKGGRTGEALDIIDGALVMFDSDPGRSKLHFARAGILRKLGNHPGALTSINEALQLARESTDCLMEGRCMMEKAMILHGKGSAGQSMKLLESAMGKFRSGDSQVDILRCSLNMGIILRGMGELEKARGALGSALDLAARTGEERLMAFALANLADLLNELGEFADAKRASEKAAEMFRALGEPLMLAVSSFNLGMAQAGLGEAGDAVRNLDMAISILEKSGLLASRIEWLERYAEVLQSLGHGEKAKAVLEKI